MCAYIYIYIYIAYIYIYSIRVQSRTFFPWRGKLERDIVGGFCDLRDDCHVCRERTLARDPRCPACPVLAILSPVHRLLLPPFPRPSSHPNVPVTCAIAPAFTPSYACNNTSRPPRSPLSPSPLRPPQHCTPCTRQVASALLPCAPAPA